MNERTNERTNERMNCTFYVPCMMAADANQNDVPSLVIIPCWISGVGIAKRTPQVPFKNIY